MENQDILNKPVGNKEIPRLLPTLRAVDTTVSKASPFKGLLKII